MIAFVVLLFIIVLLFGFPIPFAVGTVSLIFVVLIEDIPLFVMVQRMFSGVDSFPLMAIPFFVLAGYTMNRGGITQRLVEFAFVLVGRIRGGLAQANIMASIFFAGISGAAVADIAALGPIELKMMKKAKYDTDFSAAVTLASSIIGPIIPPSLIAIIYGTTLDISIGGLFAAGFIPGLMMGLLLILYCAVTAKKRNYPRSQDPISAKKVLFSFIDAFAALLLPIIILGGILGGIFTPTEAGAIAAGYALIVSFLFFDLKFSDLSELFISTGKTTGFILWIIACANVLAWIVNIHHLPQLVQSALLSLTNNPLIILLIISFIMLIVGMFIDVNASIIIFCPVFAPTLYSLGFHPLHVGMLMVLNLSLGMATPPFGTALFLTSNLAGIPLEKVVRAVAPLLFLEIAVLILACLFPEIALIIPKMLGFVY